ncbi:MAG: NADH-quinone oxidoreductase subunit K [Acidimicrobiia bacterium]|nr:NADH-quinone oxidoreductase subunit K [Acidimicrobiia bacterium]MBT8214595.1 NADH-quinone oxidoreductase subunit K [Acidimicrobiia bacterium]NNF69342.1 sodium:proton antiporter [Acidimicrobiia bacterium]
MSVVLAVTAGALVAAGTYLLLQRLLTRIVIGLGLIAHGANLVLLGSGGPPAAPPVIDGSGAPISDPLPQALVLTAIVITFGVTAFLLALAYRSYLLTSSDGVEDDVEDRRIAGFAGGGST